MHRRRAYSKFDDTMIAVLELATMCGLGEDLGHCPDAHIADTQRPGQDVGGYGTVPDRQPGRDPLPRAHARGDQAPRGAAAQHGASIVTDTYTPPKVNELRLDVARRRAGTQGLGYDKVLADVVLLLDAHAKSRRGEPDDALVAHLASKYGLPGTQT